MTDAHSGPITHHYTVHFPAHGPRPGDPHYIDFEHYRSTHVGTAQCYVGERVGTSQCITDKPLELHHAHIEWSLVNGVEMAALEHDYPGISDPDSVGAWVETDANFRWLCVWHHRGQGGAHSAAHADWEASCYVPGLIT